MHRPRRGTIPLQMCTFCLEMKRPTFDLSSATASDSEKRNVVEKYFRHAFMFSANRIDRICYECWQKIEDFDDFCNHIAYVHQTHFVEEFDTKLALPQLQADTIDHYNGEIDDYIHEEQPIEIAAIYEQVPVVIVTKNEPDDISYSDSGDPQTGDVEEICPDNDPDYSITSHSSTKRSARKNAKTKQITSIAGKKSAKSALNFVCELCGHKAGSKQNHENHVEVNHMNNTYECDICGSKTRSKYSMYDHMRRIHILKLHKTFIECNICGKKITKRSFREHMYSQHYDDEMSPYRCSMCGKGFRSKIKMKEHENSHTGRMTLECTECGQWFRYSADLSTHRRRMHKKVQKYKCHFCERLYKNPLSRYGHIRKSHPGEKLPPYTFRKH